MKELTETQIKFLEYCERLGWGEIKVIIKDGQPVMAIRPLQDEKFD